MANEAQILVYVVTRGLDHEGTFRLDGVFGSRAAVLAAYPDRARDPGFIANLEALTAGEKMEHREEGARFSSDYMDVTCCVVGVMHGINI